MPGDFLEAQLDMDRIKAEEMDDFGKTEAEQMHGNFLEAGLDMGKIEAEEEDSGVEEEEGSVYVAGVAMIRRIPHFPAQRAGMRLRSTYT